MSQKFFLQLFADGEGAAASGATAQDAAEQAETPAAAEENAENQPSREEQFAKFKSDFKSEYDAEVQVIVKDRLKKANADAQKAKEYRDKTGKVFEALSAMYGIDAEDIDGIVDAVNQDDSFYRQAAFDKGMDVAEYRRVRQLEADNKRFNQEREAQQEADRQRQFFERISREVQIAQATYPDFNIQTEANDPRFQRMVESGVDCKTAYEIIHHDEMQEAIKRQAAQEVARKMQADALQMGSRPSENGVKAPNAVESKTRIGSLTQEQMEELNERAKRGERIDLVHIF